MTTEASKPLGSDIYRILREAKAGENQERRDAIRYPFCRPVIIESGKLRLSGFSREVSETGIGLLHNVKLAGGEVHVTIPAEPGHAVRIRVRIVWCAPCGEGWYISGGDFVDMIHLGE